MKVTVTFVILMVAFVVVVMPSGEQQDTPLSTDQQKVQLKDLYCKNDIDRKKADKCLGKALPSGTSFLTTLGIDLCSGPFDLTKLTDDKEKLTEACNCISK